MAVQHVMERGDSFDNQTAVRHMYVSVASLSSKPNAIIGSLAFIVTDPRQDAPPLTHYFKSVDWEQPGRAYSFRTIQAWMGRSALARRSIVNQTEPVQVADALRALAQAYRNHGCEAVWGDPQDIAILNSAFEEYKIECPWKTDHERDIRSVWATMLDLGMAPDIQRGDTEPADVPLGDAAFIARGVAMMYRGLRSSALAKEHILTPEEGKGVVHSGTGRIPAGQDPAE